MSFTPDGFPLLGESAAARNLWLAQAIWVTHSAGCGRALAELMTHGDALLDLHECDPQRFDAHGTSPSYARVRGAQGYREVYDVIHPRQQSEQARGLRTTPFYERQADLGAHFFESAGWERPQWYEANRELLTGDEVLPHDEWAARHWSPVVQAEHRACRERVGLFDLTPFTKVEVRGPGALAFLQRLAANDVDKPIGVIVYTAMLSPRGAIMCDLTITRLAEDRFWVVTGGAVGRHDVAWMRRHVPGDGSVVLTDLTSSLCCLGVWGSLARDLVGSRTEDDLSNEAMAYMRAGTADIGHVACRLLRVSYVGELGWEIYAPAELGRRLWDTLWDAGRSLGAVACGGAAYDSLRLEKGYRLWGQDIDEEHDPYEAGLGWAVRLGKDADFIGRDAAAAVAERGVTRRLCCLVTDDPAVMLVGKEPLLDGDAAGRLRDERGLRRHAGREHPLRLPAGRARRAGHGARRAQRRRRPSRDGGQRAALRSGDGAPARRRGRGALAAGHLVEPRGDRHDRALVCGVRVAQRRNARQPFAGQRQRACDEQRADLAAQRRGRRRSRRGPPARRPAPAPPRRTTPSASPRSAARHRTREHAPPPGSRHAAARAPAAAPATAPPPRPRGRSPR